MLLSRSTSVPGQHHEGMMCLVGWLRVFVSWFDDTTVVVLPPTEKRLLSVVVVGLDEMESLESWSWS